MSLFDSKNFNGEVFGKYVDTIPNTKRNELIKSRAIRQRPDLVQAMSDQTGGNYITTPLLGLISGSTPSNYDGGTDISTHNTDTYTHSRVVVGRSNGWAEKDFAFDVTGGTDFMESVASQISEYWGDVDQATLIHILNGLFKMSDDMGKAFVESHTNDITEKVNSEGVTGVMDGTTLNTAMQKACGDNKGRFSLAIMHSVVATNLENLKLLVYAKYNDENGMERDVAIGTLNGRTVLVDDGMPITEVEIEGETVSAYVTYVLGDGAIEFTNCGAKVPYEMDRDAKANGGEDILYSRQRKCFAPYGINFTKVSMASPSPTDEELEKGVNWELVNNGQDGDARKYIDSKAIAIARIISLG